jgi:hypothetical protein
VAQTSRLPQHFSRFSLLCHNLHKNFIMSLMKAVVTTGDGNVALRNVPKPQLGPTQVLVRIFAAAQNPPDRTGFSELGLIQSDILSHADMKITYRTTEGVISGDDFAGRVEAIGAEVAAGVRFVGERVAGFLNGSVDEKTGGSFSEYCVADAHVLVSLPDSLAYEDAAGLGLAAFTAAQVLWISQNGLPTPDAPAVTPFPVRARSLSPATYFTCIRSWSGPVRLQSVNIPSSSQNFPGCASSPPPPRKTTRF